MDYVYVNLNPSCNPLYSNFICFKFCFFAQFSTLCTFDQFSGSSPNFRVLRPIFRFHIVAQFSIAQMSSPNDPSPNLPSARFITTRSFNVPSISPLPYLIPTSPNEGFHVSESDLLYLFLLSVKM